MEPQPNHYAYPTNGCCEGWGGMDIRTWLAGQALGATPVFIWYNGQDGQRSTGLDVDTTARMCVALADAVIRELQKGYRGPSPARQEDK